MADRGRPRPEVLRPALQEGQGIPERPDRRAGDHVQLQRQRPDHRAHAGRGRRRRSAQRLGNAVRPEGPPRGQREALAPGPQPGLPEDARRRRLGPGELGLGDDRRGGPRDGRPRARVQLPAEMGPADADGVGLDPLRPGHAHVRVGHGYRAQHQLHHGRYRRRPSRRVLPRLRQRPDQDPVQGDRGDVGHLAHAQQRDPDHAGRQRYRHDDRAADHPGLGHMPRSPVRPPSPTPISRRPTSASGCNSRPASTPRPRATSTRSRRLRARPAPWPPRSRLSTLDDVRDDPVLHQPGPARVRHRPGPAADRHAG